MSSSKTSNLSFWGISVVAVILFALLVIGSFGEVTLIRHGLTNDLINKGEGSSGTTQVAWYDLARTVSLHNPAVGVDLASSQAAQGAPEAAISTLSSYPAYQPAALLKAQLLIAQNQAGQAQAVVEPFKLQSAEADYTLAEAEAEQGDITDAVTLLNTSIQRFGDNDQAALLQDYLQMAVGQSPSAPVASPEAAGTLKNAIGNKTAVAQYLYRLGLLNASEHVLSGLSVQSTASYLLQASIALSQINPSKSEALQDYLEALTLDPTDSAIQAKVLDLAHQLHDSAATSRVQQIQSASISG